MHTTCAFESQSWKWAQKGNQPSVWHKTMKHIHLDHVERFHALDSMDMIKLLMHPFQHVIGYWLMAVG